jgi:uncharacterized protein (UPF0297 family)
MKHVKLFEDFLDESFLNEIEPINEIAMSSAGVKSFLRAMYTNADVLKKMGFNSFKDLVGYIKSNDLRDWDELRDEAREYGLVVTEAIMNESKESDILAKEIDKAIVKIDDSLSYKDFALAVAKVLKDEYGTHNFAPFMEVLHKDLGIK